MFFKIFILTQNDLYNIFILLKTNYENTIFMDFFYLVKYSF